MEMRKYFPLLPLLLVLAFLLYYAPKYGLIYDGGLYASLGRSLTNLEYSFNDSPGDVPPPVSGVACLFHSFRW